MICVGYKLSVFFFLDLVRFFLGPSYIIIGDGLDWIGILLINGSENTIHWAENCLVLSRVRLIHWSFLV